jgi:hypothetical protein
MRFTDVLMSAATQVSWGAADDVGAWATVVVANGGSVSAGRITQLNTYVNTLKAAGVWQLIDDEFPLVAENEAQALTSLKQRRLAVAVNSPTFTIDRGYAFNGTTQYIGPGFIPSTHALAMTAANMRAGVYERANINTATYSIGTFDSSTRNIAIIPRSNGDAFRFLLNSALTSYQTSVTDSRAFWVGSRTAAGVFEGYKNGASTGTQAPSNAAVLPTRALYIGARNNIGTASDFRATTIGWATVGASMSAAQELAYYNALQTFMTAVGAQV